MITELRVRDLATIADVTLQLGPGLNVLTGETGAGKSMLVDALALLLGDRAASGSVRPGAGKAIVEGAFESLDARTRREIEALGLDVEDSRLVVRREVSAEGRSRAWVNGSPTTASVLGQLGALLVDLHGQHETQSLLQADAQRDMLDAFAHAEAERSAVAEAHAALSELRAQEQSLASRRDEVRRRADYLRHVVGEIDQARLKQGEDEALQVEARRLSQAGALGEQAQRIVDALEGDAGNALGALGMADRALAGLEKVDPAVAGWREMLDAAYTNLAELAQQASAYAGEVEEDPERLAEVERRRDLLFKLMGKYGATLDAVLATRDASAAELDLLDTADVDLRALAARRASGESALASAAAAPQRDSADRRRPARPRGDSAPAPARTAGRQADRLAHAPRRAGRPRPGDGALRRAAQRRARGEAARARGIGRRALTADAGAQGRAGASRRDRDSRIRRSGSGHRWGGGRAGGRRAGRGRRTSSGARHHPSAADRGPGGPAPRGEQGGARRDRDE